MYADSSTVLLVTLDDDDRECKPKTLWKDIKESGLTLANLQIANTSWYEEKQNSVDPPDVRL